MKQSDFWRESSSTERPAGQSFRKNKWILKKKTAPNPTLFLNFGRIYILILFIKNTASTQTFCVLYPNSFWWLAVFYRLWCRPSCILKTSCDLTTNSADNWQLYCTCSSITLEWRVIYTIKACSTPKKWGAKWQLFACYYSFSFEILSRHHDMWTMNMLCQGILSVLATAKRGRLVVIYYLAHNHFSKLLIGPHFPCFVKMTTLITRPHCFHTTLTLLLTSTIEENVWRCAAFTVSTWK